MPAARLVRPLRDCLRGSLTARLARANQYGGCEAGGQECGGACEGKGVGGRLHGPGPGGGVRAPRRQ